MTASAHCDRAAGHRGTLTGMLTLASLGMFIYGGYSFGWAAVDLVRGARLELWAELG